MAPFAGCYVYDDLKHNKMLLASSLYPVVLLGCIFLCMFQQLVASRQGAIRTLFFDNVCTVSVR